MGNHDAAACGSEGSGGLQPDRQDAILWTRHALEPEIQDLLKGLPERREA